MYLKVFQPTSYLRKNAGFKPQTRAFSLLELMTVLAIASIMAVLVVPSISGLTDATKMNSSASEISMLLDQARQYAIAQNTYVWVAFSEVSSNAGPDLSVVTLASKDGTDSVDWSSGTPIQLPSSNLELVAKIQTLSQIQLVGANQLTFSGLPSTGQVQNSLSNVLTFQLYNPATSKIATFNQVIQFMPDGGARVGSSPVRSVELGLQITKGGVANTKNVAVIRIAGMAGSNRLYRP